MNEVILIKYGELTTKKDNRRLFINILKNNIIKSLEDYNITIKDEMCRMFIETTDNVDEVIDILSDVFGIHEIYKTMSFKDRDINSINLNVLEFLNDKDIHSFKVVTKRSDKSYKIESNDVNKIVGEHILNNIKNSFVDLFNPEVIINIEIRQNDVYLYGKGTKGKGGYPVGSLGKGMLMLSGGIDSVVAGYLSLKRGVKLSYVYFESIPHTSIEARNKVIQLANILRKYSYDTSLYVVPFTNIQESIYKNGKEDYCITIMRRMMYRIGELLAKRYKCNAIFNGESIGQVASQTLSSIRAVNDVTSFPIIRPLASFDKLEIIDIANKIDTYKTSILPYEDCCTVFVPKHPVINPSILICKEIEKSIEYESLINEAMDNILKIDIDGKKEINEYL
ncbi:MAG: tRNA uracil 4-sulfurtransferase ThiI [Bacilli bacterium]